VDRIAGKCIIIYKSVVPEFRDCIKHLPTSDWHLGLVLDFEQPTVLFKQARLFTCWHVDSGDLPFALLQDHEPFSLPPVFYGPYNNTVNSYC
jgi:hypothetical protein